MIMFSNNKTASWLCTKTVQEREEILKKAHLSINAFTKLGDKNFLEECAALLQAKSL